MLPVSLDSVLSPWIYVTQEHCLTAIATSHVIVAFGRVWCQIESSTKPLEAVPADALRIKTGARNATDPTISLFAECTGGGNVASERCSMVELLNMFHLNSPAVGLPLLFQCVVSDGKDELNCRTSSFS